MAVERIYEFSTGITYEIRNGQWVSMGFTVGEYMNKTIANIPQCVERAIANNLFEVSKNSQSQEPTIVGRVVRGNKAKSELDWSVVAIVTPGADDYQRHTGFYRYFLCSGADSLWKIVDWIEDYRNNYNNWPIYNPADTKKIGQQTRHDCGRQKPELNIQVHDFLNQRPTPLIFNSEAGYDLTTLNAMAEYKAQTKSQLTSWAWNVEALEDSTSFLVIQAANQTAYNLLNDMRQSQASQPRPVLGSGIDMAGIKSSIKGLIGGGNIKQEWIQTVVQAKKQNQLTSQQWEQIFNDLGANSGSVSANIVRLLTLRAIILPETLPYYLQYLDIKKQTQNPNQQQITSREFQSQIRDYRNLLDDLLSEGAISVAELIGSHKKMEYVPAVAWLFDNTQPGPWLKYKEVLVSKVQESFKNFQSPRKEYESLEKLFKTWRYKLYVSSHPSLPRIGPRLRGSIISQEQENISLVERLESNIVEVIVQGLVFVIFLILAITSEANNSVAYLCFYAIASGLIRVFLNKDQLDNTFKVLGLFFTIVITFIALLLNNWESNYLGDKKVDKNNVANQDTSSTSQNSTSVDPGREGAKNTQDTNQNPSSLLPANPVDFTNGNANSSLGTIPGDKKQKAIDRFDETRTAIQNIVDELAQELPSLEELNYQEEQQAKKKIVIAALRETLGSNKFNLQYGQVIEGEVEDDPTKEGYRDIWIKAISSYQKNSLNWTQGFGYIEKGNSSEEALKKDIKKNPLFAFRPRTRVTLNKLVEELKTGATGGAPTTGIKKIKNALGFQGDYTKAMQGDQEEIKKLIETIKTYQQTNGLGL